MFSSFRGVVGRAMDGWMVIIGHQSSKSTFGDNYNLLIHFLQEEMNEMVSHTVSFWGKTLDQDQD